MGDKLKAKGYYPQPVKDAIGKINAHYKTLKAQGGTVADDWFNSIKPKVDKDAKGRDVSGGPTDAQFQDFYLELAKTIPAPEIHASVGVPTPPIHVPVPAPKTMAQKAVETYAATLGGGSAAFLGDAPRDYQALAKKIPCPPGILLPPLLLSVGGDAAAQEAFKKTQELVTQIYYSTEGEPAVKMAAVESWLGAIPSGIAGLSGYYQAQALKELTVSSAAVDDPVSHSAELVVYLKGPDIVTQAKVTEAIGEQRDALMQGTESPELSSIPLKTYTLGDINAARQTVSLDASSAVQFTIVGPGSEGHGINARYLYEAALGQNCVTQVASQFNRLESKTTDVASVSDWDGDPTQGPQASLQSEDAALHRYAHYSNGEDHALKEVFAGCMVPSGADEHSAQQNVLEKYPDLYKNGYLELWRIPNTAEGNRDLAALQGHIHANINKLSILPQWAQCGGEEGGQQLQVFCAAPSFQLSIDELDELNTNPAGQALLASRERYVDREHRSSQSPTDIAAFASYDAICEDLVVAQYKATAQLAVLRSKETGQPVPLHLTLVGQGAFNNPASVMQKAMQAVAKEVAGTQVQVYLHAWNEDAVEQYEAACTGTPGLTTKSITADEFSEQPHPDISDKQEHDAEREEPSTHDKHVELISAALSRVSDFGEIDNEEDEAERQKELVSLREMSIKFQSAGHEGDVLSDEEVTHLEQVMAAYDPDADEVDEHDVGEDELSTHDKHVELISAALSRVYGFGEIDNEEDEAERQKELVSLREMSTKFQDVGHEGDVLSAEELAHLEQVMTDYDPDVDEVDEHDVGEEELSTHDKHLALLKTALGKVEGVGKLEDQEEEESRQATLSHIRGKIQEFGENEEATLTQVEITGLEQVMTDCDPDVDEVDEHDVGEEELSTHDKHLQKLLEAQDRLEEFGQLDNEEDEEERQATLKSIRARIDEFTSVGHETDTLREEELQYLESLMEEYDLGEDEPDAVDDGRLDLDIGTADGESRQPIPTPAPQGFNDDMWKTLKASAHEERFGAIPLLDFTNMRSWHDFGNMGLQSSRNWKTDADPENPAQEKFNLSWTTKLSNQTDRVEVSRDREAGTITIKANAARADSGSTKGYGVDKAIDLAIKAAELLGRGNAKVTINNGTVADAIKVYETLTKAGIKVELGPKMEKMFRAAANGDREALHILDPMGNTDFRSLSQMGASARGILADQGIDYTKPVATKEPVEQEGSSPSHLGDRMRGVSDAYTTDSLHQRDGSTHPPLLSQSEEAARRAKASGHGTPEPVEDPKVKTLVQIGDIASSLTKLTETGVSFSSLPEDSPEREALKECRRTMDDIRDSIADGGALPTQLQIDAIKATIAAMKTNPTSVTTLKRQVDSLTPSPSSPSPLD